MLITLLVAVIVFALVWWLIAIIPFPPPPFPPFIRTVLFIILIVIAIAWLINFSGVRLWR